MNIRASVFSLLLILLLIGCKAELPTGSLLYNTPEEAVAGIAVVPEENLTPELLNSGLVLQEDESRSIRMLSGEQYAGDAYANIREVHLIGRAEPGSTPPVRYIKLDAQAAGQSEADQRTSIESDTEEGPGITDQIGESVNSLSKRPIPIVSILLLIIAFWISTGPLRNMIVRRESPQTMSFRAESVRTTDNVIPFVDGELRFVLSMRADQVAARKALGLEKALENIERELIQWVRWVGRQGPLAEFDSSLDSSAKQLGSGNDVRGFNRHVWDQVGIKPVAVAIQDIARTPEQEDQIQSLVNAHATRQEAEALGISVWKLLYLRALRQNPIALLGNMLHSQANDGTAEELRGDNHEF